MIEITGSDVTVESVLRVAKRHLKSGAGRGANRVQLATSARKKMKKSRSYIEREMKKGAVIYGANTGFGALSAVRISNSDIVELQRNLIRSHSVGVGAPFTREETRAIMYLRANTLARGHSGIRPEVVDKILEFLNADVLPIVPSQDKT